MPGRVVPGAAGSAALPIRPECLDERCFGHQELEDRRARNGHRAPTRRERAGRYEGSGNADERGSCADEHGCCGVEGGGVMGFLQLRDEASDCRARDAEAWQQAWMQASEMPLTNSLRAMRAGHGPQGFERRQHCFLHRQIDAGIANSDAATDNGDHPLLRRRKPAFRGASALPETLRGNPRSSGLGKTNEQPSLLRPGNQPRSIRVHPRLIRVHLRSPFGPPPHTRIAKRDHPGYRP